MRASITAVTILKNREKHPRTETEIDKAGTDAKDEYKMVARNAIIALCVVSASNLVGVVSISQEDSQTREILNKKTASSCSKQGGDNLCT